MEQRESEVCLAAPPFPYFTECGRSVYQPGDRHPNRSNLGMFDLILVEKGRLFIGEEDRQWEVSAGGTLLLLPDRYHYAVRPCTEETSFVWIHFRALAEWGVRTDGDTAFVDREGHMNRYATAPYTIRLPQLGTLPGAPGSSGEGERLLRLQERSLSGAVWERQRLFEQLLRSLDLRGRDPSGSPAASVAERTERYIRAHYAKPLTGAALSEALHFHYNYLTRCMKRVNGLTPMEYLEECRLEQARLLLLRTESSVASVAEQVGFETAPYFSRRFSERFGVPPLKFRQRYTR
ncbi:helix-turn-helix transcriptional regulator [Saccharibacillus qingshengii]|uniref:helix-turn-helix transcriptional regulator n=1 Tax=Saccharibacillus qingshengii TaxID=1763540 RepID=UPI0015567273|nr:AraC family transcriptional regulator [Saccharibacillus qingshengii]